MNATYYDGSGNKYHINNKELKYDPIKAEYSSSGVYDGGEAKSVILSNEQILEIKKVFRAAMTDISSHIEKRSMGSGQLNYQDKTIRLSMRSKPKMEIEEILKSALIV